MKKSNVLLCFFAGAILISCNSTRIENSWRDPDTQVSIGKLKKVLVMALLKDETSRRAAEDEMAALLKGKAVPSYAYLGSAVKKFDETEILERLRKDGFDGAVTMRLVDVDKEVDYTPGTINSYPVYYRSFGRYYVRSWNYYSTPDRYQTTKSYSIETNVYSIMQNKLIWSGLTITVNPSKADRMTSEVSNTVYKRMLKEGFITE